MVDLGKKVKSLLMSVTKKVKSLGVVVKRKVKSSFGGKRKDELSLKKELLLIAVKRKNKLVLINHIRWSLEQADAASLAVSSRANILLGFIGIEFSYFVAKIKPFSKSGIHFSKASLGLLAVALLLILAAAFALLACISNKISHKAMMDFKWGAKQDSEVLDAVIEHLIATSESKSSWIIDKMPFGLDGNGLLGVSFCFFIFSQIVLVIKLSFT